MRISDWSSDVCSSDLRGGAGTRRHAAVRPLPLRPLILLENRLLGPILESFQLRMNRNCAIRMERGATMGPEGDLEVGLRLDLVKTATFAVLHFGVGFAVAYLLKIGRASCGERVCQYG